jgi:hypothetical protein
VLPKGAEGGAAVERAERLSAPEASSSPLRAIQRIHVPGVIEKLLLFYLFPFRFSRSAHRLATGRKKFGAWRGRPPSVDRSSDERLAVTPEG